MPQWKISKIFKKFIYVSKESPFTLYVKDYTKNIKWRNPIKSILIPYFAFLTKDIKSYNTVLDIDNVNQSIHGNITYDDNGEYESSPVYLKSIESLRVPVGRPCTTGIVVCGKTINLTISLFAIHYAKRSHIQTLIADNLIVTIVDYDTNQEYYRSNKISFYYNDRIEIKHTINFQNYVSNKRLLILVYNMNSSIQPQLITARLLILSQPFIPYRSHGQLNVIKLNNISFYNEFSTNIPISNRIFLEFSDDVANEKSLYGFGASGIYDVYIDNNKVLTIDSQNYKDKFGIHNSSENAFGLLLFDLGNFNNKVHTLKIKGTHDYAVPLMKIYYVHDTSYNMNNINVLAFEDN